MKYKSLKVFVLVFLVLIAGGLLVRDLTKPVNVSAIYYGDEPPDPCANVTGNCTTTADCSSKSPQPQQCLPGKCGMPFCQVVSQCSSLGLTCGKDPNGFACGSCGNGQTCSSGKLCCCSALLSEDR